MNIKCKKKGIFFLIVATVLILSFLSWAYFARNIGSMVLSNYVARQETSNVTYHVEKQDGKENEVATAENSLNRLYNYIGTACNLLDGIIDKVSSKWEIYRQSSFSKIDSIATYIVTGEISSVQVIGGTGGWLFYGSRTDGNSIGDYEGTNSYTQKDMNEIYQSALSVQNDMKNRGIKFAILVPPNKENVYSEYMPDTYVHSEQSRTNLLIDYLSNKGINIISPKTELLQNHERFQLYYSYDTHWNQLGAYIGVRDTLRSWGIEIPELAKRSISSSPLKNQYHYCGADDLANMLGMRSVFSDEIEYTVDETILMDWTSFENEQTNSKVSHFHNEDAFIKGTLLLVGDSFRSSAIPTLREQFTDVYVVSRSYFASEMIDEIAPDYVITEYVERYSSNIKNVDSLFK